MNTQDFLMDAAGNLRIENGDFVIGDATDQNIKEILSSHKGEYKEYPEIGVGIEDMLNEDDYNEMLVEAKKNLEYDGMTVEELRFLEDGNLIVDAKYK